MKRNQKIIYGLERLSDAYKTLLWEKAKTHGISPIQIQILLFIHNHKPDLCNVSHLAKTFNVTKPTISDAVRVLIKKTHLEKDFSSKDSRSFSLFLTPTGKSLIHQIIDYTLPLENNLKKIEDGELDQLYATISSLIYKLNQSGILAVQRTCYGCRFYSKQHQQHHCSLLNQTLHPTDIRLDCPEFETKD